jgi:hypothetical protein
MIDYRKAAAHFHATLSANAANPELPGPDCVAWADRHWPEFLPEATVRLGRALENPNRSAQDLRLVLDAMEKYANEKASANL